MTTRVAFTTVFSAMAALGIGTAVAPAMASSGPPSPAPTSYSVSSGAAQAAASYWTPARMAAATPLDGRAGDVTLTKLQAESIPGAHRFAGTPTVGTLFMTEDGAHDHFCTASVVNGGHSNLLITAAHCLYGSGYRHNVAFVPMYDRGREPYGIWTAKRLTVSSGWRADHNTGLDFGFVALNTRGGKEIASVTKANTLVIDRGYGRGYLVDGYPTASNAPVDEPIWCYNHVSEYPAGQLRFYCSGYYGGTSGSPFLLDFNHSTNTGLVNGVIGGYQEGGDVDYISYSSYFNRNVWNLRAAAAATS